MKKTINKVLIVSLLLSAMPMQGGWLKSFKKHAGWVVTTIIGGLGVYAWYKKRKKRSILFKKKNKKQSSETLCLMGSTDVFLPDRKLFDVPKQAERENTCGARALLNGYLFAYNGVVDYSGDHGDKINVVISTLNNCIKKVCKLLPLETKLAQSAGLEIPCLDLADQIVQLNKEVDKLAKPYQNLETTNIIELAQELEIPTNNLFIIAKAHELNLNNLNESFPQVECHDSETIVGNADQLIQDKLLNLKSGFSTEPLQLILGDIDGSAVGKWIACVIKCEDGQLKPYYLDSHEHPSVHMDTIKENIIALLNSVE